MEFTISAFVNRIREVMYENFPYEEESVNIAKHVLGTRGKVKDPRPYHIRDVAFMNNPISFMENSATFDIGNEFAEENYPYYHILQDAQVIHVKGAGTKQSKGSQQYINPKNRDYNKVEWNGKTFSQEYNKNVRGSRSKYSSARRTVDIGGKKVVINRNADYYVNKHYKYIDRILDASMPYIAQEFGLRAMRKQDTGLEEEYNMQQDESFDNLLEAMYSMEE